MATAFKNGIGWHIYSAAEDMRMVMPGTSQLPPVPVDEDSQGKTAEGFWWFIIVCKEVNTCLHIESQTLYCIKVEIRDRDLLPGSNPRQWGSVPLRYAAPCICYDECAQSADRESIYLLKLKEFGLLKFYGGRVTCL